MSELSNGVDVYIASLTEILRQSKNTDDLYGKIVNAPFVSKIDAGQLFLGIVVLLIENPKTKNIDRVALSDTELAMNTTTITRIPFHEIKIPIDHTDNIIAKAIKTAKPQKTTDWKYLFTPVLDDNEARLNQASGGIATSYVYPIVGTTTKGALIFSYFQYLNNISSEHIEFMERYTQLVSDYIDRFS